MIPQKRYSRGHKHASHTINTTLCSLHTLQVARIQHTLVCVHGVNFRDLNSKQRRDDSILFASAFLIICFMFIIFKLFVICL